MYTPNYSVYISKHQINTVLLVMILRSIYRSKTGRLKKTGEKKSDKKRQDLAKLGIYSFRFMYDHMIPCTNRSLIKGSVILLPLLGLTWVFGLFKIQQSSHGSSQSLTHFRYIRVRSVSLPS